MSKWTDKEKFKNETLRILLLAIMGFIATIVIVQPFKDTAENDSFVIKEKIRIKKEVIDSFLKTSYLYSSSIYKVLSAVPKPSKEQIKIYESSYKEYRVDLNRMILYFNIKKFKKHHYLVLESNNLRYKLRQIYNKRVKNKNWKILRNEFKEKNNEIARLALKAIGL